MRFIFIVQGEGRGHLTQALTLEERLRSEGHEVVEVLVGKSRYRKLPDFFGRQLKAPLKRFESPNFLPMPSNRRNNITGSVIYNPVPLSPQRFPYAESKSHRDTHAQDIHPSHFHRCGA